MEPIQYESLFPTPLFRTKLYPDDLELLKDDIVNKHKEYVSSGNVNEEMLADGENAFTGLQYNEKYSSFMGRINEIVSHTLKQVYCYDDDIEPYVCDMWSTCCCPGESGEGHYHCNSQFSGTFYPFDETPSEISFYSPNHEKNSLNINGNVSEWNPLNCTQYTIKPEKCDLIFFPSYLKHKVQQNKTNIVRYSLAFNVYLKGNLKAKTGTLYLPGPYNNDTVSSVF